MPTTLRIDEIRREHGRVHVFWTEGDPLPRARGKSSSEFPSPAALRDYATQPNAPTPFDMRLKLALRAWLAVDPGMDDPAQAERQTASIVEVSDRAAP